MVGEIGHYAGDDEGGEELEGTDCVEGEARVVGGGGFGAAVEHRGEESLLCCGILESVVHGVVRGKVVL